MASVISVGLGSFASPGGLTLLDDRLDRRLCRGEVGHRDQLGPPEVPHGGLGFGRSDEDSVLSVLLDEAFEALLDPPVEMTHGGELLLVRHDDAAGDEGRYHLTGELQLRRVVLHALGSLEEDEAPQGLLAERHESQLESRWIVFGRLREVRPAEVRGAAYRSEQVARRGQMQHLLGGYLRYYPLPSFDGHELLLGQPFAGAGLETEGGEEVLEHQHMLQL